MSRNAKYHRLGRVLLILGFFGLYGVGCSERPSGMGADKTNGIDVRVPGNAVAVVAIDRKGTPKIYAVDKGSQGNRKNPRTCEENNPGPGQKCNFNKPVVYETNVEIGEVPEGEEAPISDKDVAGNVAFATNLVSCRFVIKVSNKVYYYPDNCTL